MSSIRTHLAVAAAAAVVVVPLAAAPADAASLATRATYRSCAQLNATYPHGVGVKGAKDKTAGRAKNKPVRTFRVDTKLYQSLPKSLDRDRDGIACEKH